MKRLGPVLRITIGLVGLTAALLIAAQLLGLVPDDSKAILDKRRRVVEALAVQVAVEIDRLDVPAAQRMLDGVLGPNPDMLSAALRTASGQIIADVGDHARLWHGSAGGPSSPNYISAPIFDGEHKWGTMEVAFAPMPLANRFVPFQSRLLALVVFVALSGSIGYFLVLRRSLKALDPSAVIPDRVRAAMDALVEGVIILDDQEQIVLANASFAERVGLPASALIGRNASSMNWRSPEPGVVEPPLPWRAAMSTRTACRGTTLLLRTAAGEECRLVVNVTPVLGANDEVHGALASFADVTLLEQRNNELQLTLARLEASQRKIEQHNVELRVLATRDPLTGCLNRRALFACFEDEIARARGNALNLACAMVDIDHFKGINDRFGHATGDKVIALVAETLRHGVGQQGVVARYGGEELCVVLPGLGPAQAHALIDGIRKALGAAVAVQFTASMQVTFSAGVASLDAGDKDPADLIARADAALYGAKQGGRNRVVIWHAGLETEDASTDASAARSHAPTARASSATGRHRVADGSGSELQAMVERVRELEGRLREQQISQSRIEPGRDPATGLPNEALFRDRILQGIARAQRSQGLLAVLHLEVESFYLVRETLGPQASEQLAAQIADRLALVVRESDTIAPIAPGPRATLVSRLAGGDFGILLGDLAAADCVAPIIQRILESTLPAVRIEGHEFATGCLIGASIYPTDGSDAGSLLALAGGARRLARSRTGTERFAFCARAAPAGDEVRPQAERELGLALERGELLLHYQPRLSLSSGRLIGLEALLRWRHPQRGLLGPADFLPLAEQSGLIVPIGEWVLQTAACEARGWQAISDIALRVAVNLSGVQLRSAQFVERVEALLHSAEVEAKFIEVEVNEAAVCGDLDGACRVLRKLRNLGVHVTLDDFGTEHSTLASPQQLPIDSLKIDGSVIAGIALTLEASELVSAIIRMAHELGIRVVAEGVESPEQMLVLRDSGCDEVQGFVICRPLPAQEVLPYLRTLGGAGVEGGATHPRPGVSVG